MKKVLNSLSTLKDFLASYIVMAVTCSLLGLAVLAVLTTLFLTALIELLPKTKRKNSSAATSAELNTLLQDWLDRR